MNTCQTSIKLVYYCSTSIPIIGEKVRDTTVGSQRTEPKGVSQADEQASQIRIIEQNYGNCRNILLTSLVY